VQRQNLRERHLARATASSTARGVVLQVCRQCEVPLFELPIEHDELGVTAGRRPKCVDRLHDLAENAG
jgi:hypothetical protein